MAWPRGSVYPSQRPACPTGAAGSQRPRGGAHSCEAWSFWVPPHGPAALSWGGRGLGGALRRLGDEWVPTAEGSHVGTRDTIYPGREPHRPHGRWGLGPGCLDCITHQATPHPELRVARPTWAMLGAGPYGAEGGRPGTEPWADRGGGPSQWPWPWRWAAAILSAREDKARQGSAASRGICMLSPPLGLLSDPRAH